MPSLGNKSHWCPATLTCSGTGCSDVPCCCFCCFRVGFGLFLWLFHLSLPLLLHVSLCPSIQLLEVVIFWVISAGHFPLSPLMPFAIFPQLLLHVLLHVCCTDYGVYCFTCSCTCRFAEQKQQCPGWRFRSKSVPHDGENRASPPNAQQFRETIMS